MRNKELIKLIISNTVVTRKHLTPEIALRLITDECPLWRCNPDKSPFKQDPFWGFYWPGGQVLSRFILDNPKAVSGKSVLDIGSGCGATAIASKMSGASQVVANDIDEVALSAIEMNCELNGVRVQSRSDNLIGNLNLTSEVVLIGDMFYSEEFAGILFDWVSCLAKRNKAIYIGDPGRHGLTMERMKALKQVAEFDLPKTCVLENTGFDRGRVWKVIS